MTNTTEETKNTTPLLNDATYNILSKLAQYWLPAAGALYFALATIWGLPAATEVIGTITAIDVFLGVILGISKVSYNASDAKYDGVITVAQTEAGETMLERLEVQVPLEGLKDKGVVTLKFKDAPYTISSPLLTVEENPPSQ